MVLNYSRIALEFYRTALKNYSETVLDMFLNIYGTVQGSNLALADLLNASSFLQKASRNCYHLLLLAS